MGVFGTAGVMVRALRRGALIKKLMMREFYEN